MQIGNLDQRVTIQTFTVVRDENGQELPVWSDLRKVWAMVKYEKTEEAYEADELVAVNVVKFFIRFYSAVTEVMRVKWEGQYYRILSIEELGLKHFLVLKAEWKDSKWFDILRSTGHGIRAVSTDDVRAVGYEGGEV